MTLGEQIRVGRETKNWSPEQLAVLMEVSKTAVCNWESDKGMPRRGKLEKLEILLGVKLDVTGSGRPVIPGVAQEYVELAMLMSKLPKVRRDAIAVLIKACAADGHKH